MPAIAAGPGKLKSRFLSQANRPARQGGRQK
jgi:hypothetical protein